MCRRLLLWSFDSLLDLLVLRMNSVARTLLAGMLRRQGVDLIPDAKTSTTGSDERQVSISVSWADALPRLCLSREEINSHQMKQHYQHKPSVIRQNCITNFIFIRHTSQTRSTATSHERNVTASGPRIVCAIRHAPLRRCHPHMSI